MRVKFILFNKLLIPIPVVQPPGIPLASKMLVHHALRAHDQASSLPLLSMKSMPKFQSRLAPARAAGAWIAAHGCRLALLCRARAIARRMVLRGRAPASFLRRQPDSGPASRPMCGATARRRSPAAAGWFCAPSGADGITPLARSEQRSVCALSWPEPDLDRRSAPSIAISSAWAVRRPGYRSPSALRATIIAAISATATVSRRRLEFGQRLQREFRRLDRRRHRSAVRKNDEPGRARASPARYSICAARAHSRAPRTTSPSGCRSADAFRCAAATSNRRPGRISTSFWHPTPSRLTRPSATTSSPTGCAARPRAPARA